MHKTILLVEDDLDTAEVMSDFLGTVGFVTRHAERVDVALAAAQSLAATQELGLILCDLKIKEGHGKNLIKQLRESSCEVLKSVPIIIVSGCGPDEIPEDCRRLPFLRKPFDIDRLYTLINGLTLKY